MIYQIGCFELHFLPSLVSATIYRVHNYKAREDGGAGCSLREQDLCVTLCGVPFCVFVFPVLKRVTAERNGSYDPGF
jgi:hypothetical protein